MSITLKYPEKFHLIALLLCALFALFCLNSCEYIPLGDLSDSCEMSAQANSRMTDIFDRWQGDPVEIEEDLIIEAYVISSDQAGNFFNELIVQDDPVQPKNGMKILIQSGDIHANYPLGSRVLIHLKSLTLDQIGGEWRLGVPQELFGNILLTGIPHNQISAVLEKDCNYEEGVEPLRISLADIATLPGLVLITLEEVQFQKEELEKSFAEPAEESLRELEDCEGQSFSLVSSGYAQFQFEQLPSLNGKITGVVESLGQRMGLRIRSLDDIEFLNDRCEKDPVGENESDAILLSELADPENDIDARFIELFNGGTATVNLDGWKLQRFTNGNTEFSHEIDLSGLVLEGGQCLVIAANEEGFLNSYGRSPDLEASGGTAANSNGDDNVQLLNADGQIVDIFGRPGEDGSGTDHEFEDGRALRHPEIKKGSSLYKAESWFLWNDTGENGTVNQPQQAPNDFSPGVHPDSSPKME